jgi:hypothetical protein
MAQVGVEDAFRFLKQTDEARLTVERRLQRDVQAVFDDFAPGILEAVQEQRQPDYDELEGALAAVLVPFFVSQFVEEAMMVSVDVGIGFDPAIINTHALEWARSYSFELIKGLTNTTRDVVSNAISSFIETPGMTQADIIKLVEPAFSKVRARMIATTETTRAYSAATNEIQKLVNRTGVQMERVWHTRNDEIVAECPICWPLHEQPELVWVGEFPDGPPAHVNCRCSTGLRVKRE